MRNHFVSGARRALVILCIAAGALIARDARAQSDTCAGASTVGVGVHSGDNFGAVTDGSSGCGGSRTVWYRYDPPSDGISVFTTCDGNPGLDTIMSLHPSCPGTSANQLICNDQDPFCASNGNASAFTWEVDGTAFYYVRLAGYQGAQGGFNLAISHTSNNACAGAPLLAIPGTYTRSSTGATTDGSSTCGGTNDVWYRVRPNASGILTIDTCGSSYDTVLSAHSACLGTTGNQIACNDDYSGCSGGASRIAFAVTANTTYRIRVASKTGTTGNFTLNLNLGPANDLCSTAQSINPGTYGNNTTTANTDASDLCTTLLAGSGKDLWYSYTPTSDELAVVSLCGSTFDTVLSVHSACPGANLSQVTCDDDAIACGPQSKLAFLAKAGTTYRIRVAGSGGASGQFSLNLATVNCGYQLYREEFELGLNGWTIDNTFGPSDNGLWHLTTACSAAMAGHTAPTALGYMVDASCNFTSPTATSGAVISPVIDLASGPLNTPVLLSMNYFLHTQGALATQDQVRIEVSTDGFGSSTVLHSNRTLIDQAVNATGQWGTLVSDLTPFVGQMVQIRVSFDTSDTASNTFPGFYIDDVTVCAPPNSLTGWEEYE